MNDPAAAGATTATPHESSPSPGKNVKPGLPSSPDEPWETGSEVERPTVTTVPCRARPIVVASFPRSGTHLTIDGLRQFFIETYRRQKFNQSVHDLYINIDRMHPDHPYPLTQERVRNTLMSIEKRVIIKTHCSIDFDQVGAVNRDFFAAILDQCDVVYVVRDVRPVMPSYMALRPIRYPDSPREIATFLRTEMDGGSSPAANWAHHVSGWLQRPGVKIIRFEEMMRDYEKAIRTLGEALNLTWNRYPIRIFPKPGSILGNKIRRVLGIQNCSSIDNLRMAFKTPNWKEVMSADDLELIREQAGQAMSAAGYEAM